MTLRSSNSPNTLNTVVNIDHYQRIILKEAEDFQCTGDKHFTRVIVAPGECEKTKGESAHYTLMREIWAAARKGNLKKLDGQIYKPMDKKPCAYVPYLSYEEFINKVLKKSALFKSGPKRFTDIMAHLKLYDDEELPILKKDLNILAFENGIVALDTVKFYAYTDKFAKNKVARHFIPQIYTGKGHTPVLDNMLLHQLQSKAHEERVEIYNVILALIGRLFFKVGQHDNWSVNLFFLGESHTGKSTLINIIKALFPRECIGALSANIEKQFGLYNLHDKQIIVAPDVPADLHLGPDATLLQSMISGEDVSVVGKHLNAFSGNFTTPMLWAGNRFPAYSNNQGQIARRFVITLFNEFIESRDTTIQQTVIANELANLVFKSLTAYWRYASRKGSDFWDFCPVYFHDNKEYINNATNYIHRFLTAGPDENKSKEACFFVRKRVLEGDARLRCTLDDVKKMFMNYMKFNHPQVKYTWDENDLTTFKQLGYEISLLHICKSCGKKAKGGKEPCCEHYHAANRTKRTYVYDLEMVREEIEPPMYDIRAGEVHQKIRSDYNGYAGSRIRA
ncbi:uncharacterized protein EV422DRAFT_572497 [Fimicolochytrium jonesii]|uniref:uncharacterized protein n=1 Tax=Fimicolochytrium jonesii TaxID=1396493 RepID=UPI0022FF455F|nr:uncharacterized protein EV422DRAFT_572497 [Fimicolochytrium jonesii]KAI8815684.1 hypothetical protein EV422DRAFT_572497 [Fimicolochytrium jonesii]